MRDIMRTSIAPARASMLRLVLLAAIAMGDGGSPRNGHSHDARRASIGGAADGHGGTA